MDGGEAKAACKKLSEDSELHLRKNLSRTDGLARTKHVQKLPWF
jgi:hypothetical protein